MIQVERDHALKLLPQSIRNKLPRLHSTEELPSDKVDIKVKFFAIRSDWTWYATEANAIVIGPDGEEREEAASYSGPDKVVDVLCYGLVRGFEAELGYFMLSELAACVAGKLPLIERDMHFGKHTLAEAQAARI